MSACLARDHREIDALLQDVEALLREGELAAAEQVFGTFRRRLERHIEAEEDVLFPVYEQLSSNDGPTRVMLGEHADIRRAMAAIAAGLARQETAPALEALPSLVRLLTVHNAKEERVIYPGTDAASEFMIDRGSLVARIRECLARE